VLITIKGVRGFLGFANFYRCFIKGFSDLVCLLTELIYKDKVFKWIDQAQILFERFKEIFISSPVLAQFDYDKKMRIEIDSSGWCVGGTLL
jgi:hypothetical protein